MEVALGIRPDGQWAAFEVAALVARQNGKGGILEAIEMASLFLYGDRLILHSAHEFKTAAEAFLRVKALIDGSDDLSRRVSRIRTSHGDEGVELRSGARLRFVARSRSSGRGFSGDKIILDEAQELPRSAMGALLPTLSARPNPQVIYTGTVPSPENDAEHWTSLRDRGRRGGDSSLAWLEWSPEEPDDEGKYDLDDRDGWVVANPALGIRISEETIQRERNSLGEVEFARERLSIWRDIDSSTVIDMGEWAALADPMSKLVDPVAFAVDVTNDGAAASIGVAGRRADDLLHVEVVENRGGTAWVLDRLVGLVVSQSACAVVVDPASAAGALIPAITERGIEVEKMSGQKMGAACGAFFNAATQGQLRHIDQPVLTAALLGARRRPISDAWGWNRKDARTDISPLVAVTLALHGFAVNGGKVVEYDVMDSVW